MKNWYRNLKRRWHVNRVVSLGEAERRAMKHQYEWAGYDADETLYWAARAEELQRARKRHLHAITKLA